MENNHVQGLVGFKHPKSPYSCGLQASQKKERKSFFIDAVVPGDHHIKAKSIKKLKKYNDLRTEVDKM